MPFIPALIVLQMLNGLAASMGWVGAQTLIGQIMQRLHAARGPARFASRIGSIAGRRDRHVWDLLGPWPSFALLALPGLAMWMTARVLPPDAPRTDDGGNPRPIAFRDLVPRLSDYIEAFRLLAVPTIAFVILMAAIRISGNGIKSSFYIVYLQHIGMTGTMIGLLSSANSSYGQFFCAHEPRGDAYHTRADPAVPDRWHLDRADLRDAAVLGTSSYSWR